MMRKCFALLLCFLQATGPALASVLTVEEVSVIGAAADDYYTGSKSKLKVLDGGKVGRTLVPSAQLSSTFALSGLTAGAAGIAGIAYYERTGKDPVYAAAQAMASAADAVFAPAYQAFKANFVSPESYPASAAQYVGVEGAVGATLGDLVDFVKNSAADSYADLKQFFQDYTPTTLPAIQVGDTLSTGSVISTPYGNMLVKSGWSWVGYYENLSRVPSTYTNFFATQSVYPVNISSISWYNNYLYRWTPGYVTASGYGMLEKMSAIPTTADATVIPGDVSTPDYTSLKQAFEQANLAAAVQDQLRQALSDMPAEHKITSADPAPSQLPAPNPSPITNNQIQNFFTENTANVYNKYLDTVNNNVTNQGDITNEVAQAAAETAKAQEEEANKETEDTYSPLNATPFQEAYSPGEFDIPARFNTFLNNVKSSGLFSFSSAFFNSLPGGGSSVYTINGGATFGTHTIDLGDTLSGGLAVLKTILLACFGFLSIRAVTMKR